MDDISWEILEDYHHQRVKEAECQIDGQVVYQNVVIDYPDDGPPDQVMAFKVPSPTLETTVTEIRWKVSQYGKVKPVVHYEPVQFPRALLSKASGHNAQYIESHQLGPGAVILVTRQGEANPQIISVLRPSPTGPSLPPEELGYEWNETHTDLLLLQEPEENEEVKTAKLKTFIKSLEIEHVSDKRLSLLVAHGWDTSTRLLRVTPEQLMTIPGIGTKIAQQLVDNLHTKVTNVSLVDIMVASGFFPNIGKKRFLSIVEVYPDFLELMDETTFDQLTQAIRRVPGFNKLADDIAVRVPDFLFWLGQNPMITIAPIEKVEAPLIVEGELKGKNVVFTGFTDRELEAAIKQQGGTVTKTVSGKTNYLIVKSKESASASAQNARAKGIPLMTRDEFVARFFG
jgi:DNA ligase (NAD+)